MSYQTKVSIYIPPGPIHSRIQCGCECQEGRYARVTAGCHTPTATRIKYS